MKVALITITAAALLAGCGGGSTSHAGAPAEPSSLAATTPASTPSSLTYTPTGDPGLDENCPNLLSVVQGIQANVADYPNNVQAGSSDWPNTLGDDSTAILHADFAVAEEGNQGYPARVEKVASAAARLSFLVYRWEQNTDMSSITPAMQGEMSKIQQGCG